MMRVDAISFLEESFPSASRWKRYYDIAIFGLDILFGKISHRLSNEEPLRAISPMACPQHHSAYDSSKKPLLVLRSHSIRASAEFNDLPGQRITHSNIAVLRGK